MQQYVLHNKQRSRIIYVPYGTADTGIAHGFVLSNGIPIDSL